jgi:hypothetical protein
LDLASEVIVYQEPDTSYNFACCHFGGGLDFYEGKLYLAIGDLFDGAGNAMCVA